MGSWTAGERAPAPVSFWQHNQMGAVCPVDGRPVKTHHTATSARGYEVWMKCPECGVQNVTNRDDPERDNFREWTAKEKETARTAAELDQDSVCPVDGAALRRNSTVEIGSTPVQPWCPRCGERTTR
jgi:uncharacterized Zn finger protein